MNDEQQMSITRLEQLLEENLELAEENNRLIREIRRTGRIAFWLKLVLWATVLILPFLLIGPILAALIPAAGGASGSTFGIPTAEQFQSLLEAYQGGSGE
jgi:hypothetical protein